MTDTITITRPSEFACMTSIAQSSGATHTSVAFSGQPGEEYGIEFDGIAYVDLKFRNTHGDTLSVSVYANAIPALIAALAEGYGEALAHRSAR